MATALGVAIGVALFVTLTAAGEGFREAARRPLAGVGADILLTRPVSGGEAEAAAQRTRGVRLPFGTSILPGEALAQVRRVSGVSDAVGALLIWDFGAASYVTVLGVDLSQATTGPGRARDWVVAGRFLQADDARAVVADRHYAAFFRLRPGAEARIGGEPFHVVGIVEVREGSQIAAANLYVPLAAAQTLARMSPGAINQIYVRVAQASMVDAVVRQIRTELGDVNATTEQSIVQVMGGIAEVSTRFTALASLVALLGGLLLTGLALASTVAERRREIGVMKAVGWTAADVRRSFVVEGLASAVLGAVVGITLGGVATLALSWIPIRLDGSNSSTPQGLSVAAGVGTTLTLPARITLGPILLALGVAIGGGVVASWLAARRAAAMAPAEALRD